MSNREAEPSWIERARRGDFAALPDSFTWDKTSEFAHLIHGYRISESLGLGPLQIWANQRINEARRSGQWTGTALELWLCLFYEHRRYRHMGEGDPEGDELSLLNQLCTQLRKKLQYLDVDEHTAIISAILISTPPPEATSLQ
jgi:hypothetical protein